MSKKREKSQFSWGKGLLWGLAFTMTAGVSAVVGVTLALLNPFAWQSDSFLKLRLFPHNDQGLSSILQYQIARPVNLLLMGVDRTLNAVPGSPESFSGRTDTMLLARLDPQDHTLRLLSIPRDTRIETPRLTVPKINQANADGGAVLAAQAVSETLNNIPIDRYVRVNTEAFKALIDLVDGIEVYVPERMKYEDKTQKLFIDLQPGLQTLNGEEAEQFARFRHDANGDIGRVQRQQVLLKALKDKLQNPSIIPRLPKIITTLQSYIDTNLSLDELLAVANFGRDLQPKELRMVMLPGRFSTPKEYQYSYWIMSPKGRDRIMEDYFNQPPLKSLTDTPETDNQESFNNLHIAIQNASSSSDLAQRFMAYLNKKQFNHVYLIQDSLEPLSQTQIVVQKGDQNSAEELQKILGFGNVEMSSTGDIQSDITLRLGDDARQFLDNLPQ